MNHPNHTSAVYTKSEVKWYNDNPFTEALPNKLSPLEFYNRIQESPDESKFTPEGSDEVRKSILLTLYRDFYAPFGSQYHLYSRFMDALYEGYASRTPKKFLEYLKKVNSWEENTFLKSSETSFLFEVVTRGFSVIGPSGTGKTTIIKKILNLLPHCIKHSKFNKFTQVPYIKLDCPEKGSTKQLCLDFFLKLDQKLGYTNYYKFYTTSRFPEYELIQQMKNKAVLHWLGVLVIDEVQNLNSVSQKAKETLLNFFKRINNAVSIPIIFIGTLEAKTVLQGNYQQARRAQGIGVIHWNEFSKKSKDWESLMKSLWKYQVLKNKVELTKEISNKYFDLTKGIIDNVITLHIAAQRAIIEGEREDDEVEEITIDILEDVAEDDLRPTTSHIKELQTYKIGSGNEFYDYQDVGIEGEGTEYPPTQNSKAKLAEPEALVTSFPEPKLSPPAGTFPQVLGDAIKGCKSPSERASKLENLGYIATKHKDLILLI